MTHCERRCLWWESSTSRRHVVGAVVPFPRAIVVGIVEPLVLLATSGCTFFVSATIAAISTSRLFSTAVLVRVSHQQGSNPAVAATVVAMLVFLF